MQYAYYISDSLTGDLRVTLFHPKGEISEFIGRHIGFTLMLFVPMAVISIAIGALLERMVFRMRNRIASGALHLSSLILLSIPVFSLGLGIMLLSEKLRLELPVAGNGTEYIEPGLGMLGSVLEHLLLPLLTGVLSTVGMFVLLARASISQRTRRKRTMKTEETGEPRERIIADGMFLIRPFPQFFLAWTMSCTLLVDALFSYGGLGELCLLAMYLHDFPLMMTCFYVISMLVLAAGVLISIVLSLVRGEGLRGAVVGWVHGERETNFSQETPQRNVSHSRSLLEFAKEM